MFALRMVQLIESHIDRLASELMRRLVASEVCRDLVQKVPAQELEMRTHEIYRHLSDWLLLKTESEMEAQYIGLGVMRVKQGVAFSDLLFALAATKECLWEYLEREGLLEDPVELLGDLNLLHELGRFFDRIAYSVAVGYERVYREENISIVEVRHHPAGVFHGLHPPLSQLSELWFLHDTHLVPMFFQRS